MARQRVKRKPRVVAGSGNVFRDLGFPDAEAELAKAELAHRVACVIDETGMTQQQAAAMLGIDQPGVSHLVRGNLRRFTIDRLLRFLIALDRDIRIVVKPKPRTRPHASIRVAPASGRRRSA